MQMEREARVPLPAGVRLISVEEAQASPVVADLRRGVPLLALHQPHSCWDPAGAGLVMAISDVVELAEQLALGRGDRRGRLMIQDVWHDIVIAPRLVALVPGRDAWWVVVRLHPNGGYWALTLQAAARRIGERLIGNGRPRLHWELASPEDLRAEAEDMALRGRRAKARISDEDWEAKAGTPGVDMAASIMGPELPQRRRLYGTRGPVVEVVPMPGASVDPPKLPGPRAAVPHREDGDEALEAAERAITKAVSANRRVQLPRPRIVTDDE